MDEKLKLLQRSAATGDKDAAEKLDRMKCRIEGHRWHNMKSIPDWMWIKVCGRCLTAEGLRLRDVTPPEIFTLANDNHKRRPAHAIIGGVLNNADAVLRNNRAAITGSYITACQRKVICMFSTAVKNCHGPVTCKQCLNKDLTLAKQEAVTIYAFTEKSHRSWQKSRKRARKRAHKKDA